MEESVVLVTPLLAGIANLTILVGEDKDGQPIKKFRVISETLRLASPVWNAMLRPDGPFLENGAHEVKFPADDPDAFQVVLQILFHQSRSLTDHLSLPTLLGLAMMVDKYDLSAVVVPIASQWSSVLETDFTNTQYPIEQNLFIAWTLGLEDKFISVLGHLVRYAKVRKDLNVLLNGRRLNVEYLPEGVQG